MASPSQDGTNSPERGPITAPVERRELLDSVTGKGKISSATLIPIHVAAPADMRAIVTATAPPVGEAPAWCEPVVGVSGRPVLLLQGDVPLHRSLHRDDTGNDVTRLQQALTNCGYGLAGDREGTLGAGTAQAANAMYARAGYTAPHLTTSFLGMAQTPTPDTKATNANLTTNSEDNLPDATEPPKAPEAQLVLPLGEAVMIGQSPRILEAQPLGAEINSDPPVVLAVGGPMLRLELSASQAAQLTEDAELDVTSGPWEAKAQLKGLLDHPISSEGGVVYQVDIPLPTDTPPTVFNQEAQYSQTDPRSGDFDLVVPAAAVYTKADAGSQVIVLDGQGKRTVPVEVLASLAGYCAVTPISGELAQGDQVVLGIETVG